tara:strand:+ start:1001 stop:1243 length:243 start_codon:yes stop_codon:yes gene_type:complete
MSDEERKGTILESVKSGVTVYELRQDGDYYKLYTVGEHGYFCGYVSNPEYMQDAIDNHEEEMSFMVCQAREEFGIHFTNH